MPIATTMTITTTTTTMKTVFVVGCIISMTMVHGSLPIYDPTPGCISECGNVSHQFATKDICHCDVSCHMNNLFCCSNFLDECSGYVGRGTCSTGCFEPISAGDCFCDSLCEFYGDCCGDFDAICLPLVGSCDQNCGNAYIPTNASDILNGQTCSCTAECGIFFNCCDDYVSFCAETFQPTQPPTFDLSAYEDFGDCGDDDGSSMEWDMGFQNARRHRRQKFSSHLNSQPINQQSTTHNDRVHFLKTFAQDHSIFRDALVGIEDDICSSAVEQTVQLLKGCITANQVQCSLLYRPYFDPAPSSSDGFLIGQSLINTQASKLSVQFTPDVPASIIRYYRNKIQAVGLNIADPVSKIPIPLSQPVIASVAKASIGLPNPTTCNPAGLFDVGIGQNQEVELLRNTNDLLINTAANGSVLINGLDLLRTLNIRESKQLDTNAYFQAIEETDGCETVNEFLAFFGISSQQQTPPSPPAPPLLTRTESQIEQIPHFCTTPDTTSFDCPSYCPSLRQNFLNAFPYLQSPLTCPKLNLTVDSDDFIDQNKLNRVVAQFQQTACPAHQMCLACAADRGDEDAGGNVDNLSWATISRTAFDLIGGLDLTSTSLANQVEQVEGKLSDADKKVWEGMMRIMTPSNDKYGWYSQTLNPSFDFQYASQIIPKSEMWQAIQKFTPYYFIDSGSASVLYKDLTNLYESIDSTDYDAMKERSDLMAALGSFVGAVSTYLKQYEPMPRRYAGALSRDHCRRVFLSDLDSAISQSIEYITTKNPDDLNADEARKFFRRQAHFLALVEERTEIGSRMFEHTRVSPKGVCSEHNWESTRKCFDNTTYQLEW